MDDHSAAPTPAIRADGEPDGAGADGDPVSERDPGRERTGGRKRTGGDERERTGDGDRKRTAAGDRERDAEDERERDGSDERTPVRVWLVERTYSDDEQNIVILVYATPDGERYLRKERALTSFGDVRDTTAAVDADPENLGTVDDPEQREIYAAEARRMRESNDPDDAI